MMLRQLGLILLAAGMLSACSKLAVVKPGAFAAGSVPLSPGTLSRLAATAASFKGGVVTVCTKLSDLAGTTADAGGIINSCIEAASDGGTVSLPPGTYTIKTQVLVDKRIRLNTSGVADSAPKCGATTGVACATLLADPEFQASGGLIRLTADGAGLDHISINGNRPGRQASASKTQCKARNTSFGYNMQMICPNCFFTNSVSMNSLCGTGLEVSGFEPGVTIANSTFAANGRHDDSMMWSDGLTVHDSANAVFSSNEFVDNTDVDFIFGGCQNCEIRNNTITHSADFASSSFASLHLQNWPGSTSGNYTGSDISGNHVDCGPYRRCGFGMYVGGDAWYPSTVHGGSVHDNTVTNAQQGINVDKTTGSVEFYNNFATSSGGGTDATCGVRDTSLYNISAESILDRSKDSVPTESYTHADWDGCIPNMTDFVATGVVVTPEPTPTRTAPAPAPVTILPSTPPTTNCSMASGTVLTVNQMVNACGGLYHLVHQDDGNVVLYGPSGPIWWTGTQGLSTSIFVMQTDGNLVLYAPGGVPLWWSGTQGNPGAWLNVQDDGNLVIYTPDLHPLWTRFNRGYR